MKTFDTMAAQGDILIVKIDALPEGVELVKPENGQNIVAHSETGHNHTCLAERTTMYRLPESIYDLFLVTGAEGDVLEHHRSFDTHDPIKLEENSIFHIKRQREHTPEGWRRVED